MDQIVAVAAFAVVLPATGPLALAADPAHGKEIFVQQCAACHGETGAGTENGPSLVGIRGRKAGAATGFRYSSPMKRSTITWDATELQAFVTNPQGTVKGTRMPFDGLRATADAEDVVAYLGSLK
jgi:cytochrome c